MRGRNAAPGLHAYRTVEGGIEVFPNATSQWQGTPPVHQQPRTATGVPGLDDLLGGGLPSAGPVLICGPAGTGKSVLATHLLSAGALRGEVAVLVVRRDGSSAYRLGARRGTQQKQAMT